MTATRVLKAIPSRLSWRGVAMLHANPCELTASGSVVEWKDEVVYRMQGNVNLYNGAVKMAQYMGGTMSVSSHRIVWRGEREAIQWHFCQITRLDTEAGGMFASPKIIVNVVPLPVAGASAPAAASAGFIKLSFKGGGRDEFLMYMRKAMDGKAWRLEPEEKRPRQERTFAPVGGITAISRAVHESIQEEASLTSQAFASLNSLIENAKEIVNLAETYAEKSKRAKAAGEAGGEGAGAGGSGGDDGTEFGSLLLHMGVVSPVTRAAAGALYHVELSRQLAEFLRVPLGRVGGMMTLTDVYCLYNRARGTSLISPDDLLEACGLFVRLGVGMHVRDFPTGVKVVQLDSHRDEAVIERVKELLSSREWISVATLSTAWRVPMAIAAQFLGLAEKHAAVCRDESLNGLRYYPNKFTVFAAALGAAPAVVAPRAATVGGK